MVQTTSDTEHERKFFPGEKVYYSIILTSTIGIGGVNDNEGFSCVKLLVNRYSVNRAGQKSISMIWPGYGKDYQGALNKARKVFDELTEKNIDRFIKENKNA